MYKGFIFLSLLMVFSLNAVQAEEAIEQYIEELTCREEYREQYIEELVRRAEQGDPKAQYRLGFLYWDGIVGAYCLGFCYDHKTAYYWFDQVIKPLETAAEEGDVEAQYKMGVLYYKGVIGTSFFGFHDYETALYFFERAAKQGHPESQYALGKLYWEGDGVEQSDEEAFFWIRKAEEQGYVLSKYFLAVAYDFGKGVKEDDERALKLYHEAQMLRLVAQAEEGNPESQYKLGEIYLSGGYRSINVDIDFEKAAFWFEKAAQQDYSDASRKLEGVMMYMEPKTMEPR